MKCKLCHQLMEQYISFYICRCQGKNCYYERRIYTPIECRCWEVTIENQRYSFYIENDSSKNTYSIYVYHYDPETQYDQCWLRYTQPGSIDVTDNVALQQEVGISPCIFPWDQPIPCFQTPTLFNKEAHAPAQKQ